MLHPPKQVNMLNRLNRNLGLLQAGSIVTLDIVTPAGQRGKFRTTFVGYLPKRYVLIQYPDANKLGNFSKYIMQGTSITVRGLSEGQEGAVVAFVGKVKQTLQIPSRLIVLDFPKTISLQNLRHSIRIDTEILVKIKIAKEIWKAVMTDISINGGQLIVRNGESLSLVNDTEVDIVIDDFNGLKDIHISAIRCNMKNQNEGVSLGVKFNENHKREVTQLMLNLITAES